MKLFVGVISSNEFICAQYAKKRAGLIPTSSLTGSLKERAQIIVGSFNPSAQSGRSAQDYLDHATRSADAAILVVEDNCISALDAVRHAFFLAELTFPQRIENAQNFLGRPLGKLLQHFSAVCEAMDHADGEESAILPIRNFAAPEMEELARVCRSDALLPNFVNGFTEQMAALRKRRRPRKQSGRQTKYYVDDRDKHFVFGKEVHSSYETGPPHLLSCKINANFRFGKRINSTRHFNVSCGDGDNTQISGSFPNCHDEFTLARPVTHLNMFSNDYF